MGVKSITVEVDGKDVVLSLEAARELQSSLNDLLQVPKPATWPITWPNDFRVNNPLEVVGPATCGVGKISHPTTMFY